MIDGLVLGTITWLSYVFSFMHFPNFLKRFMLKHFFLTDIISVTFTFFLLSSISQSLGSVVGSMFCGLLVNISLIAKNTMDKINYEHRST
jgi:hypothetical protein